MDKKEIYTKLLWYVVEGSYVLGDDKLLVLMKHCIDNGANLDSTNSDGTTPIQMAILNKNVEVLKFLLENGASLDVRSEAKYTLLHYAAGACNTEIIEFLLEKGLDVNAQDFKGNTPLHFFFIYADCDTRAANVIKLFLASEADINKKNNAGHTPLDLCKRIKNVSPPAHIDPEIIHLMESYAKKGKTNE